MCSSEVRTAFWSGSRGQHWAYSILERLPLFWVPGVTSRGDTFVFRIRPGTVDKMTIQGSGEAMRVWRDGFYLPQTNEPWLRWTDTSWQPESQGLPVSDWEREPAVLTRTLGSYDVPISPDKSAVLRVFNNWAQDRHGEVSLKHGTSEQLLWSMTEQVRYGPPKD